MKFLILTAAFLASGSAHALDIQCMGHRPIFDDRSVERPDMPTCQDSYFAFSDEWDFNSCKRELESYNLELNGYLACLDSEAGEAVDEYNEAVQAFNRRASM